jgi:hypothetical protein
MDTRTRTILLWTGVVILILAGVVTLFLSFSGPKDSTTEVNAIYTNAALTLAAQVQTLQAEMLSATPNPASLSSPTPTFTPLPSPTFQQPAPLVLATSTTGVGVATGCDNSVYISDVTIPDGTTITPGQVFTKTWKVSNTGTCAWTAAYQIILISGDMMGGKATALGKIVNPGESTDVSVALTSPTAAGSVKGTWRLSNANSQPFGTLLTVVIKSGATTGTVSVTPTKTALGSASATPTKTLTPVVIVVTATFTFTPTAAPVATTAVPTNTNTLVPTNTPVTPTPTP